MECLKCGQLNDDNAKHCTRCRTKLIKRLFDRNDWQSNFKKTSMVLVVAYLLIFVGAILVLTNSTFASTVVGLVLAVIAGIFVGNGSRLRSVLKWWKQRVAKSEDSAREYAAMVEWESDSIGLEPVSKIEFRRKIKNNS